MTAPERSFDDLAATVGQLRADFDAFKSTAFGRFPSFERAVGQPLRLDGATAPTRYVGRTTAGAPTTGAFEVGDWALGVQGQLFMCTAAGSPGTWTPSGTGYARYHSTSSQSVSSGSNTTVSLPTAAASTPWVTSSTSGAGHRFAVGVAGIWAVTATMRFIGDPGVCQCYGALVSNAYGSEQVITALGGYSSGAAHTINLAYIGLFDATDYVFCQAYQDSGSSRSLEGQAGWRNINLALVRRT